MGTSDKTRASRARTVGWLFVAAGSINVAASFSSNSQGLAVAAMVFFVGAIIMFWQSKKKE